MAFLGKAMFNMILLTLGVGVRLGHHEEDSHLPHPFVMAKSNSTYSFISVYDATDAVYAYSRLLESGHGIESVHSNTALVQAYLLALGIMIFIVSAMFWESGVAIVVQVILYVASLAFIKIALKVVYEYDFKYPIFITALHLLSSSVAAFAVLLFRWLKMGKRIAVPTRHELLTGIVPIALFFGLSIGLENCALVVVSAAFSEVVAASNPIMSAFLTFVLGMGFKLNHLQPILVVVIGCLISITGELYFSAMGLLMLFSAVLLRGFKAVIQQKLMTGETKDKFDPATLMAWSCFTSFLGLGAYSFTTEHVQVASFVNSPHLTGLLTSLMGSCVIACVLNVSALYVIREIGAVGMQLVSQMKSLLVVIGGVALLGESFTPTQMFGFATVLVGVYWFSRMKRRGCDPEPK